LTGGAIATWARKHLQHFTLKEQVGDALIKKLEGEFLESKHYVVEYFLLQFPSVILLPYSIWRCIRAISSSIRNGDSSRDGEEFTRDNLIRNIRSFPENWQKAFAEALKDMTDESNPAILLLDGIPFLKIFDDDDVPF
jgi:hypothetical protein